MKRVINFILQHFLTVLVSAGFIFWIFDTFSDPDFDLLESLERNNINWGAGVIFIFIAFISLCVVGVFRVLKIPNRKITNGLIIETEYNFSAGNRYAYVRYWVDDVPYVIKSKYMDGLFYKGDYWRVAYNEKKPEQADLCPMIRAYVISGCMFIFGLFCIIFDLFFL